MAPLAAATVDCYHQQQQPLLAPLQRKPSFVVKPSAPPSLAAKTPMLHPVALAPERCCASTIPLEFLSTIARVEINETRVRDGVTYYVLDIFRRHFDTRLPARLNNLRHQVSDASNPTSPAAAAAPCHAGIAPAHMNAKPDYRIERRFSDFSILRAQVYEAATLEPQFRCAYCDEFIVYVRFRGQQPRSLTKLTTGTRSRMTMLAAFTNDLVRMAQWRELQSRACQSHHHIPEFVAQFLQMEGHERPGSETEVSMLLGSPFSSPRD